MGWANSNRKNKECDLDISAFLFDIDGQFLCERDMVYHAQKHEKHESGAVFFVPCPGSSNTDNTEGGNGTDDNERLMVELPKIPERIGRILFAVTIHEAEQRGVNFGSTSKAYARLVDEIQNDDMQGKELVRSDLKVKFPGMNAVVVAEIHRNSAGGWNYKTIGDGMTGGFNAVCERLGIVNI